MPGPQGEALFVSGGRLLGAFTLVEPPAADSAQGLPVPDPLGVAIDRDHQLPHAVVAMDREGADVEAYPAAAHEPASRRTFNGAVGLLREHLAARQKDAEVVYVKGGRTDDSAGEALRASVDAAMHEVMASRHRAVLERLEAELTGGRALQGIPAVKEALAEGRVETLLLHGRRRRPAALLTQGVLAPPTAAPFPFPYVTGFRALPARRVFSAQAEVTRCQSSV
ncbi:hypothetical protein [Streptomyces lydicus]|uniref:hypothetical protein n=1 Tax=Streptomyces lydicus TaxID=47763 RepID=UPI0036E6D4B5